MSHACIYYYLLISDGRRFGGRGFRTGISCMHLSVSKDKNNLFLAVSMTSSVGLYKAVQSPQLYAMHSDIPLHKPVLRTPDSPALYVTLVATACNIICRTDTFIAIAIETHAR